MKHELPILPYQLNELEPHISKQTLEFHYGKHHNAYVTNLNNLIPGTEFENSSLEEIVMKAEGGIFNNGAQVWNHTFYFMSFSPKGKAQPSGKLLEKINESFGSYEAFKQAFSTSAATLFASGWAWLVVNKEGKLEITQESNAGNPLRKGLKPILTCDVWEHAYYLDKQNRRPDYIASFWELIDWKVIEGRL
ncbi:MAG: superoxide dismutase [Bacteroidales bacterium]|nr:superoxide dismutase [Bacteroidales bacterium]